MLLGVFVFVCVVVCCVCGMHRASVCVLCVWRAPGVCVVCCVWCEPGMCVCVCVV